MTDSDNTFERTALTRKDRAELATIAEVLGQKPASRMKKAEIVDLILALTGVSDTEAGETAPQSTVGLASGDAAVTGSQPGAGSAEPASGQRVDGDGTPSRGTSQVEGTETGNGLNDSTQLSIIASAAEPSQSDVAPTRSATNEGGSRPASSGRDTARAQSRRQPSRTEAGSSESSASDDVSSVTSGPVSANSTSVDVGDTAKPDESQPAASGREQITANDSAQPYVSGGANEDGDLDGAGRGRRRRRRGRDRAEVEGAPQGATNGGEWDGEPLEVTGLLDLRDDGYGFLRVAGFLPSRDDVYVSVRQCRQLGLRKGDHIAGSARPAGYKEKNPALLRVDTVNGLPAEQAVDRARFEDFEAVYPTQQLALSDSSDLTDHSGRILDVIAPIGYGHRVLIASPPRSGKTTLVQSIARSVEKNAPDAHLIVLLIDERPEEVTEFRSAITSGEVVASTFDRPPEEHVMVAELSLEHALRLVEYGNDVVIVVDGLTRLTRAYQAVGTPSGKPMTGTIERAALYPVKRLFGSARKVADGGSLTIIATASIDSGSAADQLIFEEIVGAATVEIYLDRALALKQVFPAVDVVNSSTRHVDELLGAETAAKVQSLRSVLNDAVAEGNPLGGIEQLRSRILATSDNASLLSRVTP